MADESGESWQTLIDATVALSTAADGLSLTADNAVAAFEKLFTALASKGNTLTPEAKAARDAAILATQHLGASRDKLDVEVAKTDGVMDEPAPEGRAEGRG